MNVYRTIKRGRRTVVVTASVVFLLVIGLVVWAVSTESIGLLQAIATAAAVTLPASIALISLDRRPSLLTAAWMAALVSGVVVLESAPMWIVMSVVWAFVVRSRPRPGSTLRWMAWGRPMLAASVAVPLLLMGIHADPVCTVTSSDGHVESVDPSTRGFDGGWNLSLGGTTTSSETTSGVESCQSDTVQWWEAALSLLASAGVLGVASRWPTAADVAKGTERRADTPV